MVKFSIYAGTSTTSTGVGADNETVKIQLERRLQIHVQHRCVCIWVLKISFPRLARESQGRQEDSVQNSYPVLEHSCQNYVRVAGSRSKSSVPNYVRRPIRTNSIRRLIAAEIRARPGAGSRRRCHPDLLYNSWRAIWANVTSARWLHWSGQWVIRHFAIQIELAY